MLGSSNKSQDHQKIETQIQIVIELKDNRNGGSDALVTG
jgi:hypothetical protein